MTRRSDQVAVQIQRYAAQALVAFAPKGGVLLTVTRSQVSPDMKQATVWVAGWGQLDTAQIAQLSRAMGREIALHLTSKFTPRLTVLDDDSGAYASHISQILHDS